MFALISPLCKGHHGDTFLLSLNLISSLISGRQQFIGKMYLKRQLSPPSQYQHFTEYTVQYLCTATVARYHRKCQCNYILKNISYKIIVIILKCEGRDFYRVAALWRYGIMTGSSRTKHYASFIASKKKTKKQKTSQFFQIKNTFSFLWEL